MGISIKVAAGMAFSVAVTLCAMLAVERLLGDSIPFEWWLFGAVCPALVSGVVCLVVMRQAHRNKLLSFRLQLALEELQHFARTDQLTGLLNRAAFLYPAAGKPKVQSWILLIDLDRFKAINDTYGHYTGDLVLRDVARVLRSCTRSTDLCGRLGGEEFAVVLYNSAGHEARAMAERLRHEIARIMISAPCGTVVSLTASIGIAPYDQKQTISTALQDADAAMYQAKRAGRNQVAVAPGLR